MTVEQEFATVDLLLSSNAETRGVDAFALSIIKCEKQVRRLLTHVVYQFPQFEARDIRELRSTLSKYRTVYFEGFIRGFDAIYPRTIQSMIGRDHSRLRPRLDEAVNHRNKIFHGQLTSQSLSREMLLEYVADIRSWCSALAVGALDELGYDGFARESFRKSERKGLWERCKVQLPDVPSYDQFIQDHMERQPKGKNGGGTLGSTKSRNSVRRASEGE